MSSSLLGIAAANLVGILHWWIIATVPFFVLAILFISLLSFMIDVGGKR